MTILAPGTPCPYCQVRPDIACPHRPADETYRPPEQPEPKPDGRSAAHRNTSGNFSQLNGSRTFVNARTGKRMRVKGRGD